MPKKNKKENVMNKRSIGFKYEDMAVKYFEERGYQVIERNYTNSFGEIDIILRKDDTLIFVEVKFRSSNRYGSPLDAVDYRKQKRISKAAFYYYAGHGYNQNVGCRFDVMAIYGDGKMEHIKNAFEYVG